MRTYNDTRSLGDAGKHLVMEYFRQCGYTVTDLTDIPGYTKMNVDFSIEFQGQKRHVCVRTDTRLCTSKNIVLETLICRRGTHSLIPGWFFTCQAEILAYLDAYTGDLFLLDWAWLKELAAHNTVGNRREFRNPVDYNSQGQVHLISLDELRACPAFKGEDKIDVHTLAKYNWERPVPF